MTIETLIWPDKYPYDYFANGADWSPVLDSDTIATCDATVLDGDVVINSPSPVNAFTGAIQRVWVKDGTQGACIVECKIVTTQGRKFAQKYRFSVM